MIGLVNIAGLLLIVFIVWWFWLYKPKAAFQARDKIARISVENGVYHPVRLRIAAHQPVQIEFLRKDASPCTEMVVFPALNVSHELALNSNTTIQLPALQPGTYEFHCQMRMYRGELEVQ